MKDLEEEKVARGIKSNKRWIVFWCVVLLALAIVAVVAFTSQKTMTVGDTPEVVHVGALTCESNEYFYPLLTYDNSDSKEFRIMATFTGDKLRSISLQQYLYYGDELSITKSETENHAAMNQDFARSGLAADSVNATYAKLQDGVRVGLYGVFGQMKDEEVKYFLIDKTIDYDYDTLKNRYSEIGLECK